MGNHETFLVKAPRDRVLFSLSVRGKEGESLLVGDNNDNERRIGFESDK